LSPQNYLDRIYYRGSTTPSAETLRSLHRAHMFTVPFENLDIGIGRSIVCDEHRFLRKIVNEHRGGFCYELNGAFAALLRSVGFDVKLLSARVFRADGSLGPEFDHMALLVELENPWIADVGFGDSFIDPLQLQAGLEQERFGKLYRITAENERYSCEVHQDGAWKPEYSFTLQPRQLPEFAPMCHYHQTSPDSHFTRNSVCSMATPQGRITLSGDRFLETCNGERTERPVSENERVAILLDRFGVKLPGTSKELTSS